MLHQVVEAGIGFHGSLRSGGLSGAEIKGRGYLRVLLSVDYECRDMDVFHRRGRVLTQEVGIGQRWKCSNVWS